MALVTGFQSSRSAFNDQRWWNKIMKQQVVEGNSHQTILTYWKMVEDGYRGDNYTFPVLLKACAHLSSSSMASVIHGHIVKTGFWTHTFVQTALLNFHSAQGHVQDAFKVFNAMNLKDLIACNSMLDAYASAGQMDKAFNLFSSMPTKDNISFNIMISGYANTGSVESARCIFHKMTTVGLGDDFSWNSMILAYTKIGEMEMAHDLFLTMPQLNVVSWNTILCGYLENGLYNDAVDLFIEVATRNELEPNHITVATALSVCARLGVLDLGVTVHRFAINAGLTWDPHVVTSLIDMYAKCGNIGRALEVFYKFNSKDKYCWNAVISGLALHGKGNAALSLFQDMKTSGFYPDDITFIGLLSACSHAGLVVEGRQVFARMENEFGITPKSEHYSCMVDILGRAGLIRSAYTLIQSMPFEPGATAWGALLSACIVHQDFEIGDIVATHLAGRPETLCEGEYVMLANLYALCGRWDEANRWRAMMDELSINKTAGCSQIEVNGRMYKFLAGNFILTN